MNFQLRSLRALKLFTLGVCFICSQAQALQEDQCKEFLDSDVEGSIWVLDQRNFGGYAERLLSFLNTNLPLSSQALNGEKKSAASGGLEGKLPDLVLFENLPEYLLKNFEAYEEVASFENGETHKIDLTRKFEIDGVSFDFVFHIEGGFREFAYRVESNGWSQVNSSDLKLSFFFRRSDGEDVSSEQERVLSSYVSLSKAIVCHKIMENFERKSKPQNDVSLAPLLEDRYSSPFPRSTAQRMLLSRLNLNIEKLDGGRMHDGYFLILLLMDLVGKDSNVLRNLEALYPELEFVATGGDLRGSVGHFVLAK